MWADAQRDGRPAKYRWRPLFDAVKFRWRPVLDCRAITLPRRRCPKLLYRSQPLVGRSSPYCGDIWRRYRCLTSFFLIVDTCLSCEVVRWCADSDFLAIFCILHFQRAACSTFQTCILISHSGHTMCGSTVDIQSQTAEIRRGKKKEERKKEEETTGWKYTGLPYSIGRP